MSQDQQSDINAHPARLQLGRDAGMSSKGSGPASGADEDYPEISTADIETEMKQAAETIDREVVMLAASSLGPDQMIETITTFWDRANFFAGQADRLRILGRLNRWATGRVLVMVKTTLEHGEFEEWLEGRRERLGFAKSSAENYMSLVRDYPTAQRFLEEDAPLRELYARGPSAEDGDHTSTQEPGSLKGRAAGRPSKTEALMKSLTTLQKRLRHVAESDELLEDDQLRQLQLVKVELDRFFREILSKPRSK